MSDSRNLLWRASIAAAALVLIVGANAFGEDTRAANRARSEAIPAHPRELEFAPIQFAPPDRAKHRHQIPGGPVVFVVEDSSVPLVDVDIHMRVGSYLDPQGGEGLASMTATLMRTGGTASYSPDEFDEEADFLAADISCSFQDYEGIASLNCLTKDFERALDLFFEMVARPRFDTDRLAIQKGRILQSLARRNDSTGSIESREWARLLYGKDHFSAEEPTRASIEGIGREDLVEFHRQWIHPQNWVIAVSGDIKGDVIVAALEERIRKAFPKEAPPLPNVPAPASDANRGVFIVDKADVNQGRVSVGHRAVTRDHPDYHAILLMNHILGGGGFTSRITSRVRSDEGLAYTARSAYEFGLFYPGEFRAYFQSRSDAVARALEIVLEEIERIRTVSPTREEVDDAIQHILGLLPTQFTTANQVANTFASDELFGRPADFWATFEEKVRAITPADVLRVAKEHLHPDRLLVLIVGHAEAILAGDPDRPEAKVETLAKRITGDDRIERIPLPDPETLVYPGE
ncbi:MAG TPA: pitrilysin family protein [Planctomycetota bacterium]|nr:pitrilysin family protein [Planctomycetota bacterium]